jgi:serine protease Do
MAIKRLATVSLATVALTGIFANGCSPSSSQGATPAEAESPSTRPFAAAPVPVPGSGAVLPDFTALVDRFGKAVVNIEVVGQPQTRMQPFRLPKDDPFFEFFRRFEMPAPFLAPDAQSPPQRGAASGFIVSPDGYILTNAHVVAKADEVTVRLTDRREFQAKVIGTDARTDVAVLKIEAKDLPVVRVGNEAALRPGDWVLAIGSPFGLENSATAGIVSATSRAVAGEVSVPFIQTDVAVNPGNSGGPLFNLQGEVVGINSMIFSRTGGYMGVSFAIPIDVAMNVRDQLIKTGRVVRGRIGVAVQDIDAALAQSFGLDRPRGALVSSVEEDSPAQHADIKPGDVILKVDEKEIDQTGTLSQYVAQRKPGESSTVVVWRGGRERKIDVRIAELEEPRSLRAGAGGASDESGRLGIAVQPLTPEEKKAADLDAGVRVVSAEGPAAAAGVRPGDIVVAVNSQRIRSVEELRKEVAKVDEGEVAALLVRRNDGQIFIPVRVGKSDA